MYCPRHMKTLDLQQMKSVSGRPDQKIAWCCDAGRQFLIFAVACGPGPTLDGKPRADSKAPKGAAKSLLQTTSKKVSKSKASHAPANVSKLSQGTGYGGTPSTSSLHHSWAHGASSVAKVAAPLKKAVINNADQELELYFFALSQLLPSQPLGGGAPSFDHRSHTGIAEILARSPLLPLASEVLRRSCVEDLGCQHQLYLSLLQFLIGISRHTDLRRVIFHPQTRYPESQQAAAIAFGPAGGTLRPSPAAYDTTQSLDTLLQQLAKFCRHFVEHAQRYPGELEDTNESRPLSVAKAVIATVGELQFSRAMAASVASMDRASTKNLGLGPLPNVLTRSRAAKLATADDEDREGKLMAEWHREHCIEEVPDDTIMDGFAFAKEAQALQGQASEKGRMKSLVIQMASLSADLPQGIYVRHGVSRLDVTRVLIMGPKGTPYANGVFEFDMFCDAKFPSRPPHMMFRTTGAGTVEFNPNLYVNGKGSTMAQGPLGSSADADKLSSVLVVAGHVVRPELGASSVHNIANPGIHSRFVAPGLAIQRHCLVDCPSRGVDDTDRSIVLTRAAGMIFNSTPWYNEPGREYHLDDARSGTYSRAIWGHTLRHATLYWLKSRLFTPPSSPKGKGPMHAVPQGAKVAADAAASENRTQANPNTATVNQPQWSTHKLPSMFWDTDGGDDILGGKLQHKASSSSKSAPLPQTMPLMQTPKVSLPATSQASQPGPSSTSAFDHPPLTANLHSGQIPPYMPPSHSFSNFGTSAQWAQLNMPQNVDTLSEDPAYMSYFKSLDSWKTMYENQLQAFAQNTQHLDFDPHHSLHYRIPMQSTVAPDRDDVLWGETLRAYFSATARTIVDTAAASPYETDPAMMVQLKDALRAHKFI